jgi:hypothetical protein
MSYLSLALVDEGNQDLVLTVVELSLSRPGDFYAMKPPSLIRWTTMEKSLQRLFAVDSIGSHNHVGLGMIFYAFQVFFRSASIVLRFAMSMKYFITSVPDRFLTLA